DGRLRCVPLPEGWQRPEFDDSAWLAPPPPDGGSTTPPGDGGAPDGGVVTCDALRIRRSFDVGPEADRLATLTLRIRYQDGVGSWPTPTSPRGPGCATAATRRRCARPPTIRRPPTTCCT